MPLWPPGGKAIDFAHLLGCEDPHTERIKSDQFTIRQFSIFANLGVMSPQRHKGHRIDQIPTPSSAYAKLSPLCNLRT